MSKKLRILSAVAALCFMGSAACFSGYAAELMNNPSGEDVTAPAADPGTAAVYTDPGTTTYTDPGATTYTDPGTTAYTDPGTTTYSDPGTTTYSDPGTTTYTNPGTTTYSDPGTTTYTDPGTTTYSDPGTTTYTDPGYTDPASTTGSYTYDPYNYDMYSYYNTTSYYMDYTSQYNQYVTNTYQAVYDDNYYYVPSYTAPQESLIEIESKQVDTDELTRDDWRSIMLDLSDGNAKDSKNGTQTFSFIKDNIEEGDTSIDWMLYLGIVLILMAVLTVIFVVITTNKANERGFQAAY